MKTIYLAANKDLILSPELQLFTRTDDISTIIDAQIYFTNEQDAYDAAAQYIKPRFVVEKITIQ